MVFDWFRRRPTTTEAAAEPAAAPEVGQDTAEDTAEDKTEAEANSESPAKSEAQTAAGPAGVPEEIPTPSAASAAAVDQDALDWARQAYARLKAEQERSQLAAVSKASEPTPEQTPEPTPEPAETAAPQPDPVDAAELVPVPLTTLESASAPVREMPTPAGPSLLELAAASRAERQQTVLAPSTEPPLKAEPSAVAIPTQVPAAPAPSSEEASPQLGSFDADFTWSAEVLAAQGRRVDQVSLEEIDWLSRLRRGLEKTRRGLVTQLLETLGDDPLTPEALDDLETSLLRADVGVQATDQVIEALRRRLNEEVVEPAEGLRFLKEQLCGLLETPIAASGEPLLAPQRDRLNVWLLVGVNGVGKTTTLGKLANLAVRSGYSCLIAAADTFALPLCSRSPSGVSAVGCR